jgi:pimeloyl-ACP methyl ester carboxylesterase
MAGRPPQLNTASSRTVAGLYHVDWNPPDQRGPPLILVHGAGGTHRHWPEEARSLPGRRVIAIDLPGHGGSPGPGRRSIADYAGDLRGLMDLLGISQAVLVGHSMGGAVALTLALDSPDRVSALGLVGTGARLRVSPAILQAAADPAAFEAAVDGMAGWFFGPGARRALRDEFTAGLRQVPAEVVHGDFSACDGFDVREQVGTIRVPTAVVCGDADQSTPPRFSEFLRASIPGARLTLIPGAGHMVALEAPGVTVAAIAAL